MDKRDFWMAFQILFWTGMRLGELLALQIKDIDFDKGTITVDESRARIEGEDLITPPKTDSSIRVITIHKELEAKKIEQLDTIEKYEVKSSDLKKLAKEVGGEEFVKIKKNDWKKINKLFTKALTSIKVQEGNEKKISSLESRISTLKDSAHKYKKFIQVEGLGHAFHEFLESLKPQSIAKKLKDKQAEVKAREQTKQSYWSKSAARRKKPEQDV